MDCLKSVNSLFIYFSCYQLGTRSLNEYYHRNNSKLSQLISPYDIVKFGRPLWGSLWLGSMDDDDRRKFNFLLDLAEQKLTGGTVYWEKNLDHRHLTFLTM